jgi:hypothetical protein
MHGVMFRWKHGSPPEEIGIISSDASAFQSQHGESMRKVVGVIAQEMEVTCPELVHQTPDGFLTVAYADIVPFIVEALKKHDKELSVVAQKSKELAFHQAKFAEQIRLLQAAAAVPLASPPSAKKHAPVKRRVSAAAPAEVSCLDKMAQCFQTKSFRLAAAAGIVIIIALILSLSVIFADLAENPPSRTIPSSPQPPPLGSESWSPKNYYPDPGFEDPSTNWIGNYSLVEYSSDSLLNQLKRTAPFDAGSVFLLTQSTSATAASVASSVSTLDVPIPRNSTIHASIWAYAAVVAASFEATIETTESATTTNEANFIRSRRFRTLKAGKRRRLGRRRPLPPGKGEGVTFPVEFHRNTEDFQRSWKIQRFFCSEGGEPNRPN